MNIKKLFPSHNVMLTYNELNIITDAVSCRHANTRELQHVIASMYVQNCERRYDQTKTLYLCSVGCYLNIVYLALIIH